MPSYTSYMRQMFVLDEDDDIESWITVNGNHIPIRKGENSKEAIYKWIESKKGNIEGNGYAESVKHYTSKQHGLAAKEYERLAHYSYKNLIKSNNRSEYEKLEGYLRRQEFHENQEKIRGIEELQREYKNRDFSMKDLSPEEQKNIYKKNFVRGKVNVHELKPEIWQEIRKDFSPEELQRKVAPNGGTVEYSVERLLKDNLSPEAHITNNAIYKVARELGVSPEKLYNAFGRIRKTD